MPNPLYKPKAVIFDVDKTITLTTSWYELTEALGADTSEHARLYISYKNGLISYKDVKKGLFELWNENKPYISKLELEEMFHAVELRGDAVSLVNELQLLGYKTCLISSSIDVFVKIVAERLAIKNWYANSIFKFDEKDNWVDFEYEKDEAGLKVKQLGEYLRQEKLERSDVVVIGDGETDIELFRVASGISVHSDLDHLNRLAWKNVKYLTKITQLLESLPDKED